MTYVRASTVSQDLSGPAQAKMIREWVKKNRVEVVAQHSDLGVCGATELDERPGLLAALHSMRELGAGLLVVAKRDRLGRSVEALVLLEREVARLGGKVVTADGSNGEDLHDRLVRRVLDAVAEHELGIIRARTKAALAVRKDRGLCTGSIPLGFKLDKDGEVLVPDVAERRAAGLARRLRADGLSLRDIAERLDEAGHRTRTGKPWHPQQVQILLRLGSRGR